MKKSETSNMENTRYVENYEYAMQEKNKMEAQLGRLQDAYEEALNREKEYF